MNLIFRFLSLSIRSTMDKEPVCLLHEKSEYKPELIIEFSKE